MSSHNSLTELLNQSGVQFRLYDMGRQIKAISPQQFSLIETGLEIYPRPYLHQAWLALNIWNAEQVQQSVVWFLKFPLDEQGYLVQAVRDDFINRLMLNINQMLESRQLSEAEDALKDNPFSFTPDQEKMAMFHAISIKEMSTEPSQYYAQCRDYFRCKLNWDNWQEMGLQGIAEVAVNIEDHQQAISLHIDKYPEPPLIALCNALEHVAIDEKLALNLLTLLEVQLPLAPINIPLCNALIRALDAAEDDQVKQKALALALHSHLSYSAQILATIAVKMADQLANPQITLLYLEKLAISEAGQQGFSRILADLMFTKNLRLAILHAFRDPNRSDQLITAIGQMFGGKF
jgi:hypothetical protein